MSQKNSNDTFGKNTEVPGERKNKKKDLENLEIQKLSIIIDG
jgi:hypothetical protein